MIWSSTGQLPSFFNLKTIRNLIENNLELNWAISFISNRNLIRNLTRNDMEINWAMSFVF